MSAKAAPIFREGFHTITPYITVDEAAELIEFVKDAFEGVEQFRTIGSAGGIHCEVRIGDSMVMIGGGGAWKGTPAPASLLVYVDDVDAVYENALKAGATSTNAPTEQEYGDRDAGVSDRFGNNWYISTRRPLEHNPADLRTITRCKVSREHLRRLNSSSRRSVPNRFTGQSLLTVMWYMPNQDW